MNNMNVKVLYVSQRLGFLMLLFLSLNPTLMLNLTQTHWATDKQVLNSRPNLS